MELEDRLPDLPTDGTDLTPPFYLFVAVPTLLGGPITSTTSSAATTSGGR